MPFSWSYLAVVVVLVLTPGADFTVIVRNTLAAGRRYGVATTLGVTAAAATQGLLVALGIAHVIVRLHPLFLAIKWAGVLFYLSLLPQFVSPSAIGGVWLAYAWLHPLVGAAWCLTVVALVNWLRPWLIRRTLRRVLDAISGTVMLGFCVRLAQEA